MRQCLLCYGDEWSTGADGSFRPVRFGRDAEGFLCSFCVRNLMALTDDEIREAHQKALEQDRLTLAKILESMMEEEKHVPETGNTRSHLARRRALRKTRAPRGKIRAK